MQKIESSSHIGQSNSAGFIFYLLRCRIEFIAYPKIKNIILCFKFNVYMRVFNKSGSMLERVLNERDQEHRVYLIGSVTLADIDRDHYFLTQSLLLKVYIALQVFGLALKRNFFLIRFVKHIPHQG